MRKKGMILLYPSYQQQQSSQGYGVSPQVLEIIKESISGEANGSAYYKKLSQLAPNPYAKKTLEKMSKDEYEHYQMFSQAYQYLTGQQVQPDMKPVNIKNYRQGLLEAFEDEITDYEKYRDTYLMTQNPLIRDLFFRPMSDEIKHATRINFLLQMI
ncbi:ferritin family protein [Fictibacillus aquaticus]|uniref:Rubrerythrin diiron-binding domain-containing protein n=1 Tax=Fictibacillus aquaticus TaxID=2021314 RepID=A0A235F6C9_9BACL|nr:ferritin-like domain-containing protein [Fictibacillus aquaticus]OYD56802.1 hypothetical protein CGZ90_17510 [Fictibacillus aquaticus]